MVYARCKNALVWTNKVRGELSDDELTLLDSVGSDDGTQFGGIKASDHCSTFQDSSVTMCAAGCQPLPQDYVTNWDISYNSNSPNADIDGAPLVINDLLASAVSCRSGYARVVGSSTIDSATCTASGWNPANLNLLITCKPGCSDVSIENGAVDTARSNTTGTSPYTVGDMVGVECGDGYVISGDSTITCTSLLRWRPSSLPECVLSSSIAAAGSAGGLEPRWALIVLLIAAVSGLGRVEVLDSPTNIIRRC